MSSNIVLSRNCIYCQKEFKAKTTVTRYCSHDCNRKHYKAVKRAEKVKSAIKLVTPIREKVHEECYSIPDAARLLGVSERTIFRLIAKKVVKPQRKGTRVRISKKELLKYKVYEYLY